MPRAVLLALLLAVAGPPTAKAERTFYVDGACGVSGNGSTLTCGPSGPFRTLNEGVAAMVPLAGIEAVNLDVRGAHDAFDGVYREYVKLWGNQALPCARLDRCTIRGCPASVCGIDETPTISGFATPTSGWTATGSGADTVYTHAVEARGNATEHVGLGQEPRDAFYGTGSGRYNPVYLLEGSGKTIMRYGGTCGGDHATLCGTDAQCTLPATCDRSAPPDGAWAFSCDGEPVTSCRVAVNPTDTAEPSSGYPIWIPDRNGLLTADGRTGCPNGEHECPSTEFLTLSHLSFEGARWVGINLQNNLNEGTEGRRITLDSLTLRYMPRYFIRLQIVRRLTLNNVLLEYGGRGLSFDTGGTFGARLFNMYDSTITNLTARHFCSAGAADLTGDDGTSETVRSCDNCDAPWNDPHATAWGPPCEALDVKQSQNINVSGLDVTDVAGGVRIDAAHDVVVEQSRITDTKNGITVNQLTPSTQFGFVRSYNVTLRNLVMDSNGEIIRGAVNLGTHVGGSQLCVTPLQAGEYFRVYDNVISRTDFAGVFACYNTLACNGGTKHLGSCTVLGSNADDQCPGGVCSPAPPGDGTITIANNTIWQERQDPTPAGGTWTHRDSSGITIQNVDPPGVDPAIPHLRITNNLIADVSRWGVQVPAATVAEDAVIDGNLYADGDGDRQCAVRWAGTCYPTLAAFRAAEPAQEPHGVEAPPRFVDPEALDLHLRVDSPARDAGVTVNGIPPTDIDGDPRAVPWDIGADEFRCQAPSDCDDGDPCDGVETCLGGVCFAGGLPHCDDANACTTDVCEPTGCRHVAMANGTPCNDGSLCTPTDECRGGLCQGLDPVTCITPDQCHVSTCDPTTGTCAVLPLVDGSSCDDGDLCTRADTCQGATCRGERPVRCAARDQCHVAGTCAPSTGLCDDPPAPDGTACDDGDACTVGDACHSGSCAGGGRDCDDRDACTTDSCTAGGCMHASLAGFAGASCAVGAGADALAGASGDQVTPPARRRLMRLLGQLRATVERAARSANSGKPLRALKLVRNTDRRTREVARALQAARRRLQVSPAFADQLGGRLASVSQALDAFRGGPAL